MFIHRTFLADAKKIIRERIIPWEGLARAGVVSEDNANQIKILEKQSTENRYATVKQQLDLYSKGLLSVLSRVKDKDDVIKNVLTLINDLVINVPGFLKTLLGLKSVDKGLPYDPFVKHLQSKEPLIKSLALYNLVILLRSAGEADAETLITVFSTITSLLELPDTNYQFIAIQYLQELVTNRSYKNIYQKHNLLTNFRPINALIDKSAGHPNATGLQLSYNVLLATWILSFNAEINKSIVHNFPQLAGNLLVIAKDSIKLKIVRISIAIIKNFVSVTTSPQDQFKVIKILLFHDDAVNTIKTLQERKFASNGSDEELFNDLAYLSDTLHEVVSKKLSSFDEYLTALENPKLISWASPTHKSTEFWLENSGKFKDNNFKLVKRIFEILSTSTNNPVVATILLNDLQFLIKNLGHDLVHFINTEKGGSYKVLVMSFLENSHGNNELKYEALKTIQLLVGHNF
ncbi:H(+)-transporting V1 sector ATPase subunit H [Lodderomyces elongisporus]|uniref:H(+)-transporting V1 sector ATPase subunit H n=1 Tax=Lodderomyces elongisporus TaxID=36914 RepID=UPI0029214E8D|nr:H(+)-transporting V1 sector ATPase subunit H [Lodderomyces elongisporus]WLF79204.1 H(+)-transporting V1 sector ATPase subunit H [Lodderomyces elongisporus]